MPFDPRDMPTGPGDNGARLDRRIIGYWLFGVAGMILVMIILGGLTRLTGSGLSIMEWDPLMGALPPLSHAEWLRLFDLYKHIPQYQLVNDSLTLGGFKQIFWLEWIHRLWGRLIGLAVLVPLVLFWFRGALDRILLRQLLALFLLGAVQGAVGWFMVESGFEPDSTAVSPERLAVHLALALVLYGAIVWLGLSIISPRRQDGPGRGRLRHVTLAATVLVGLTILAGALVAGLHAGLTYNTFPLMDGRLIPAGYADLQPFWRNLFQNIAAVQFDHRVLATLSTLTVAGVIGVGLGIPPFRGLRARLFALGIAVTVQYTLGVCTLLFVVPVDLAAAHQFCAALLLTALLVLLHALRPARD